jgi:hypothetical protein
LANASVSDIDLNADIQTAGSETIGDGAALI